MVFVKELYKTGRGQIFEGMNEFEEAAAAAAAPAQSTMEQYLKSWDLSMYIDKFKEHSIDFETLQILSPDDIKDLIPVIGHRARLISQISMLKNIITDAFSQSKTTDAIEDVISMDDVYLIDGSTYALTEQAEEPPSDAEPQREQKKRCERIGQNIRDGIIKSKDAVEVIRDVQRIYHGKYDDDEDDK